MLRLHAVPGVLPAQLPVQLGWELLPLSSLNTESCAWEGAVVIHGVSLRFR